MQVDIKLVPQDTVLGDLSIGSYFTIPNSGLVYVRMSGSCPEGLNVIVLADSRLYFRAYPYNTKVIPLQITSITAEECKPS